MCIFAQPVVDVSQTNIFARMLPDGRQGLVYQMQFETQIENAIILPLPVAHGSGNGEEALEFVSLKQYDNFFDDLPDGFPVIQPPIAFPAARSPSNAIDSPKIELQVHEVGDFIASYVPSLGDFGRLNARFRVADEAWKQLPAYSDYGFAVFRLKSLSGKPHPMAFRFHSRLANKQGGSLFFPTVHIHDGEVHSREHFDHTLYLQSADFDAVCGNYGSGPETDPQTGYQRSKQPASGFCRTDRAANMVDGDLLIHRRVMRGTLKNEDVVVKLKPNQSAAGLLGYTSPPVPQTTAAAAGVVGLMGLKWFCNRRDRVAADEKGSASNSGESVG